MTGRKWYLVLAFLSIVGVYLGVTPTSSYAQGEYYIIQDGSATGRPALGGAGTEVAGSVTVNYDTGDSYVTSYTNSSGQQVLHYCQCSAGCCGSTSTPPPTVNTGTLTQEEIAQSGADPNCANGCGCPGKIGVPV